MATSSIRGTGRDPHTMRGFQTIDYAIFITYLIASVYIGIRFVKEQRTRRDYFVASKSMNYIIVGISVMAALFSGISYMGAPAETYTNGIGFSLVLLGFFVATPITTLLFLPFFCNLKLYSAYEYLERRFGVSVRAISSGLFIIRVMLWLATATYAPALALKAVTGVPIWVSILLTGLLTTTYTSLGGMKAVIWTDTVQFFVLVGGMVAVFAYALGAIPGGLTEAIGIAREAGHLKLNFSIDPRQRVTVWGCVLAMIFTHLVQMATDQVSVQRYLTTPNLREAQRSLWMKLVLTVPVAGMFYLAGLVLFAYYHQPEMAAPNLAKPDYILPHFVVNTLPAGMPGALIAAIYAATMSTISAGLNALTTATLEDFHRRFVNPKASEERTLVLARRITFGYGALVIGLAFLVHHLGTLVEISNKANGLLGGPLLGIFLLGMVTRRANTQGTIIGWVLGLAALAVAIFVFRVSFTLYGMIGCVVTLLAGWGISHLFRKPRHEQLKGLVAKRGMWPRGEGK